jgi:tetratricopeptide (TPR) repeat protein
MAGGRNTTESVEDLIDKAWESPTRAKRAHYARLALTADPEAIDAYVALSFTVPTRAEYIALLHEAVRLGGIRWRREIQSVAGSRFFWGGIETRPYMRAVHNLALALWLQGGREQREEAVDLVEQLLRLNPNDNQGVRYLALAWYPVLDNWKRVEKILAAYSEDNGLECSYARCLDAFRCKREPLTYLEQAIAANPYVPDLLLGEKRRPPDRSDGYVTLGSPDHAQSYVDDNRDAWNAVPGALAWLRQATSKFRSAKKSKRFVRSPP